MREGPRPPPRARLAAAGHGRGGGRRAGDLRGRTCGRARRFAARRLDRRSATRARDPHRFLGLEADRDASDDRGTGRGARGGRRPRRGPAVLDPPGRPLGQPLARPHRRERAEAHPARRLGAHAGCVRPACGCLCAPGGERQHVAPPRPPRGERTSRAHQDHAERLPPERRPARRCAGALAGRDDPRGRELLAARRERDPLAARGTALVGPRPARKRPGCRPSPPLRRCRSRRHLCRVDDPLLHVRREPSRPLVADRPLDVARPAPERVRGRRSCSVLRVRRSQRTSRCRGWSPVS